MILFPTREPVLSAIERNCFTALDEVNNEAIKVAKDGVRPFRQTLKSVGPAKLHEDTQGLLLSHTAFLALAPHIHDVYFKMTNIGAFVPDEKRADQCHFFLSAGATEAMLHGTTYGIKGILDDFAGCSLRLNLSQEFVDRCQQGDNPHASATHKRPLLKSFREFEVCTKVCSPMAGVPMRVLLAPLQRYLAGCATMAAFDIGRISMHYFVNALQCVLPEARCAPLAPFTTATFYCSGQTCCLDAALTQALSQARQVLDALRSDVVATAPPAPVPSSYLWSDTADKTLSAFVAPRGVLDRLRSGRTDTPGVLPPFVLGESWRCVGCHRPPLPIAIAPCVAQPLAAALERSVRGRQAAASDGAAVTPAECGELAQLASAEHHLAESAHVTTISTVMIGSRYWVPLYDTAGMLALVRALTASQHVYDHVAGALDDHPVPVERQPAVKWFDKPTPGNELGWVHTEAIAWARDFDTRLVERGGIGKEHIKADAYGVGASEAGDAKPEIIFDHANRLSPRAPPPDNVDADAWYEQRDCVGGKQCFFNKYLSISAAEDVERFVFGGICGKIAAMTSEDVVAEMKESGVSASTIKRFLDENIHSSLSSLHFTYEHAINHTFAGSFAPCDDDRIQWTIREVMLLRSIGGGWHQRSVEEFLQSLLGFGLLSLNCGSEFALKVLTDPALSLALDIVRDDGEALHMLLLNDLALFPKARCYVGRSGTHESEPATGIASGARRKRKTKEERVCACAEHGVNCPGFRQSDEPAVKRQRVARLQTHYMPGKQKGGGSEPVFRTTARSLAAAIKQLKSSGCSLRALFDGGEVAIDAWLAANVQGLKDVNAHIVAREAMMASAGDALKDATANSDGDRIVRWHGGRGRVLKIAAKPAERVLAFLCCRSDLNAASEELADYTNAYVLGRPPSNPPCVPAPLRAHSQSGALLPAQPLRLLCVQRAAEQTYPQVHDTPCRGVAEREATLSGQALQRSSNGMRPVAHAANSAQTLLRADAIPPHGALSVRALQTTCGAGGTLCTCAHNIQRHGK